ncbi:MAG: hypothetical protein Q9169_008455 [Polycauliona sp. 2 TL-2023]
MSTPSQSSRSPRTLPAAFYTPVAMQQDQLPNQSQSSIAINNGIFTPDSSPNHPPTPRSLTSHPEALHEIGLTLFEVDEVLRRRASLSMRLNDSPTPIPRKALKNGSGHFLSNDVHDDGLVASDNMGGCHCIPAGGAVTALSTAFTTSPGIYQNGMQTRNLSIHTTPIQHQRTCSPPFNIISPSPSSTSNSSSDSPHSGVLLNYHSSPSSSSISTSASSSSSASSLHDIEVSGPLRSMAMTIKRLEDRIAELEVRFRDLEDEVEHWNMEAEKVSVQGDEGVGWFMF